MSKEASASQRIDQLIAGITDWRGKTFAGVRRTIPGRTSDSGVGIWSRFTFQKASKFAPSP